MRPEFESAAIAGDVLALGALLSVGADVDAKDRHGQTALMLAEERRMTSLCADITNAKESRA